MKNLTQKKAYIILAIIILSALMLYTYFFFGKKKGYDSDEIYSYSLSNSYYKPFLEAPENWNMNYVSETAQYLKTWINGSVFHDYITVQKGEQFAYGSVWYNQSKDVHPPFYYAALHTICSFFPDIYSPWFALSINYISFILVMFLLYKLGSRWSSSSFALFLCGFYAFSAGAVDTYTFLRMYALCTLFALFLFYLMEIYLRTFHKKYLFFLFVITLLSSLTHYYLILFAFFLTLTTELYLLLKKNWKSFFALGFVMLLGVISAFCIFPASINHLLYTGNGFASQSLSPYYQARYIIRLVVQQFTGITLPYLRTYFPIYATTFLGAVTVLLLLSFYLFRKENWAYIFFNGLKKILFHVVNGFKSLKKHLPTSCSILIITLLCLFLFYIFSLPIATMMDNAIRYLFPFYPLLSIVALYVIKCITPTSTKHFIKVGIALLIGTILSVNSVFLTPHCFLFDSVKLQGTQLQDLPSDATYIIFVSKSFHIANFAIILEDKKNIYFECIDNDTDIFSNAISTLPENATNHPIYFIFADTEESNINFLNKRTESDWLSIAAKLPYTDNNIFVGTDYTNSYLYKIYQIH